MNRKEVRHHRRRVVVVGIVLVALVGPASLGAVTPLPPVSRYEARRYEREAQACLSRFGPAEACTILLDTSIRFDPNRASARYLLGWSYYLAGEAARALAELASAYRLDPRLTDTLLLMGNLYLDQGQLRLAEKKYRQYQAIEEKDPRAAHGLATVAVLRGDIRLAGRLLEQALSRDPDLAAVVEADPRWEAAREDPRIRGLLDAHEPVREE